MNVLKKKSARVIAFLLSTALFSASAFICINAWKNYDTKLNSLSEKEFTNGHEYQNELNSVMNKLWLFGNMYVRNLDSEGSLKGSQFYQKSVISNMKKAGLMDSKGNLTLPESTLFNYAIGTNENIFSNFDNKIDFYKLSEPQTYEIVRTANLNAYPWEHYFSWNSYEFNWYDNNHGMEYYYAGSLGGYAVFDYDTSKLKSYTDELGATVYLNEDGSSPIPSEFISGSKTKNNSYDTTILYDENDSSKIIGYSSEPDYTSNGSELMFNLYVRPIDSVIEERESISQEMKTAENKMLDIWIKTIPLWAVFAILVIYILIAGGYNVNSGKYQMDILKNVWSELFVVLIVVLATGCVLTVDFYYETCSNLNISNTSFNAITTAIFTVTVMTAFLALNTLVIRLKCKQLIASSFIGKVFKYIKKHLK